MQQTLKIKIMVKLNNTVIKCKTPSHGKKIIAFFQSNGIDTNGYEGTITDNLQTEFLLPALNDRISCYYGVINGVFKNYTLFKVIQTNAKIIKLPSKTDNTNDSVEANVDEAEIEAVKTLLRSIGEDVDRAGLLDTPRRYVKFLKEFCKPQEFNMTTFENEGSDEMIIEDNIPFYSLCEHHLAPFFGTASIAYIPNKKIVGLSKLPRTLDYFANKPQNQERITQQVAEFLMKELQPKGVAVVLKAQHMCVAMRGVKKHDTYTITSAMKGVFYDDMNTRQEFLQFIKK